MQRSSKRRDAIGPANLFMDHNHPRLEVSSKDKLSFMGLVNR